MSLRATATSVAERASCAKLSAATANDTAPDRAAGARSAADMGSDTVPDRAVGTKLTEWLTAADTASESIADRAGCSNPIATAANETGSVAADIAKIYGLLSEISSGHNNKLDEIHRTTTSMESKLTAITTRLSDVESRLDFLEDINKTLTADPPATRAELESLRERVDDLDSRSRRNNLVFVGFPESCEDSGALSFLAGVIPDIIELDFPKGLEIDRAHRALAPRRADGQPPRAIVARFLRYQDRDRIMQAARNKGKLMWRGHRIMIFPDYSKAVNDKRKRFKQCKQMLHERRIGFSLRYPAVLVINPKGEGGRRREFDDPQKALEYIGTL